LIVSLGYALSKLVFRTKLAFLKTCGGLNVPDSTCLDTNGCEMFSSADAKLATAAMQPAKRAVDLMLGSSQDTRAYRRNWGGVDGLAGLESLWRSQQLGADASCPLDSAGRWRVPLRATLRFSAPLPAPALPNFRSSHTFGFAN
jgi:hypothetical protein